MLSSRTARPYTVYSQRWQVKYTENGVVCQEGARSFKELSSIKMDFQFSDEPKDMRRALRDFAKGEVKDFTQEWYIREESPLSLNPGSLRRCR
jgi:hypothetical protein